MATTTSKAWLPVAMGSDGTGVNGPFCFTKPEAVDWCRRVMEEVDRNVLSFCVYEVVSRELIEVIFEEVAE